MEATKPIHTVVLDAGPMLKNDPPISSLLAKTERLVSIPAVISEIRDANARARVETTWIPFLEILSPNAQSIRLVTDFARKTGDLVVLSRTDVEVLALTLQLEDQKNGMSNIRSTPGQQLRKKTSPRSPEGDASETQATAPNNESSQQLSRPNTKTPEISSLDVGGIDSQEHSDAFNDLSEATDALLVFDNSIPESAHLEKDKPPQSQSPQSGPDDSDSDSDGWITPANIQKHQAQDQNAAIPISAAKPIDIACITSDFAMQNVILSMNLNLLNSSLQRVRNLKTYVLRCHACFEKTKDMKKQFCPRCGKPTLTRVSCSTNSRGEFKMHLKKNMQWNHRGDRYSIPKPISGSANGKVGQGKGGGKGGWGQDLILAEDQKEYLRATGGDGRRKETDLMDQDYLPSILTGHRGRAGGRPKVGAGRNINSKKR
ncbi:MAG: hypothetical protein LQ346_006594 [Caloplaca aetnensis]|nr:MAG: hypothetical protein LQ346_006594 [Caloplaca aetnensis]